MENGRFLGRICELKESPETALENCQTGQEADLTLPVEFLHFQHF
jgi:hypothetical protein